MGVLNGLFGFPRKDAGEVGRAVAGRLLRFATNAGRVVSSLISVDASGNLSTPGRVDAATSTDGSARLSSRGSGGSHAATFGHSDAPYSAVEQRASGLIYVGGDGTGGLPPLMTITGDTVIIGQNATAYILIGPAPSIRAQGALKVYGTGGAADASAALDIGDVDGGGVYRGFLPPRHTATTRDAIASPATGLIIYNTTAARLEMWDGAAWVGFSTTP